MAPVVAVFLLCGACIFCLTTGQAALDLTIIPEANDDAVVLAVVGKIQLSGIFPDDNSLLRRIAYVESKDGNDAATYRLGYDGGIWQVDQFRFLITQNTVQHPDLLTKYLQIQSQWGISWPSVVWNDLRKPFYSGLAASLILSTINEAIPLATEFELQGNYWKAHYNSDATDTVQQFVNDVTALEQTIGIYNTCTTTDVLAINAHTSRYQLAFCIFDVIHASMNLISLLGLHVFVLLIIMTGTPSLFCSMPI